MDDLRFRLYLQRTAVIGLIIPLAVLSLNCAVDPLWYIGGNHLFPENYAFNERFAKVNRYLAHPEAYDCIVFGSSRVTLLNENNIASHACFNFSISAGTPPEFVDYAKYVNAKGRSPELVIVGVDGRNFWRQELVYNTPKFVRDLGKPPRLFKAYLSLDVLDFSLRTLFRNSPYPRYYNSEFTVSILPGTLPYRPILHPG
jgi:hypothetical protein